MRMFTCITALLAGCASIGDAITPDASVLLDPFDGKTIIRQPLVNAASAMGEPRHVLGFEWNQKFPEVIFITAGTAIGAKSIQSLAFNADGRVFENLKPASLLTDIRYDGSERRFEMALADFQVIARANSVKMRLGGINDYAVSSFGPGAGNGLAMVNLKFAPFLEKVRLARAGLKLN